MIANYVRGDTVPVRFSFRQELGQGKLTESRQVGKATCQVMDTGEGKICLGEFSEDLKSKLPAGSRVRGHYKVTKVPDWFENAVYKLARGKKVTIEQKVDRNYYLFEGVRISAYKLRVITTFLIDIKSTVTLWEEK